MTIVNGYMSLFQVCLVLMFLSTGMVSAAENEEGVRLFDKGHYILNGYMEVLKDDTNKLTIDQVVSKEYQGIFKHSGDGVLNLGVSPHTYWLKVTLRYPNQYPNIEREKQWYLEIDKTLLGVAELYLLQDDGSYEVKTSDLRMDLYDKEVVHVNSVFPVSLFLGDKKTLYIKLQNSSTALYFLLSLWDPSVFLEKVAIEEFVYGLFFGGMLMLMLYNFFVYAAVKDDSYFYYLMFLVSVTFYEVLEIGHGVMHLKIIIDSIGKDYVAVAVWITLWWALKFFISFLNVEKEHPRINIGCKILLWTVFVSAVISGIKNDYNSILWVSIFAMFFIVGMLAMTVYIWWKGSRHAKFFLLAWSCNGIGFTIYAAMINQMIPATWFTIASAPFGILLEATLLSFALAERIKIERGKVLEADKRVVENMSRYRSVFDNALEGMYRMSLDGVITNVNSSMARILGFSQTEDMIDRNSEITSILYRNHSNQLVELMRVGFENREFRFEREDGFDVWVNHSAKVIFDRSGCPVHIEGSVVDIGEIKEKEAAVNSQLKERVSRDAAMVATEEKSHFLSLMSHCIRTPLTAVIGYSELLHDTELEGRQKIGYVDTVMENSRQLLYLINNILDLSKIESGKFDIEIIPLSISEVVFDLKQEFEGRCKERHVIFSVVLQYPLPSLILSDSLRVLQVLRNLCSNALKYCDEGGVKLDVMWEAEKLIFLVSRGGSSVEKESMELLFEFDEDLGLPLSKKLAALMAGDITVFCEEDKGCGFRFHVEAALASDITWIENPIEGLPGGGLNDTTKSISMHDQSKAAPVLNGVVLLAEDNVVNQALISKIVRKLGVTVIVANDGVEVCDLCDDEVPDVILMDINMPRRGGIEAVEILRARGLTMPIYALTAETDKEETDKAIVAGCQGILAKPVNRQQIQKMLQQCLKG